MAETTLEQWTTLVTQQVQERLGHRSCLLSDPDHLLDETVIRRLTSQGWQVQSVNTPLELRLAYEQSRQQNLRDSYLVLYIPQFLARRIPYDIQQATENVEISLKDFFPMLSQAILRQLPASWLPVIFDNLAQLSPARPEPWDDAQTLAFIMSDCLSLDLPTRLALKDWLGLMFDIVLYDLEIPLTIRDAILERDVSGWADALRPILTAPAQARIFLQQTWHAYLSIFDHPGMQTAENSRDLLVGAAGCLLDQRDLQSRMSALLAENLLTPPVLPKENGLPDWIRPGVHYHLDRVRSLTSRLEQLIDQVPGKSAVLADWYQFAWRWADWRVDYLREEQDTRSIQEHLAVFQPALEENFTAWLQAHYTALQAQPYLPFPAMVHQVGHYLSAQYHPDENQPLALLIVDGMALEDWIALRQEWMKLGLDWQISERSMLALIPTITAVSRQALMAGKLPFQFPGNWLSLQREEAAWRLFWEEHQVNPISIAYRRGLGYRAIDQEAGPISEVEEILNQPHLAVVGLIVNTVDEMLHSTILGPSGLQKQIRLWARQGYLRSLVARLLEHCPTVILTSDHGHISGKGIGDLPLQEVASERALRVRLFMDNAFGTISQQRSDVIQWVSAGLPPGATVIVPRGDGLFTRTGETAISHGGASIEEVIIPFVTITR